MMKTAGSEALTLKGTRTESSQRKIEVVVQTGLQFARATDLHSLVQTATDAVRELCGAEFGAFFYNVIDAAGESYQLYTVSGAERERFSKVPVPRDTAVFAPTFEGTGVVRSGDITKDARYGKNAPYYRMLAGHLPVRSYLAVPVMAHSGEVLGGLFYGHSEPEMFEQDAEDLVAVVAAQVAVAIENFRLREELNRKIADLERAEELYKRAWRDAAVLAAIVTSSEDAIISKDLTGKIMSWNDAAARLFGYSAQEIVGRSILTLIPEELHGEETTILRKIRAGQPIEHFETVRMKKNGERMEVSLTISPVRDETGKVIGASKILRDISHKKQLERSIIQAEKIAATGRMAATIAHEINNPLEAVVNLLYLVKVSADNPDEVMQYAAAAEGEVSRVSHIARQTLGYYRENAAAGPADISELADTAIKVYEPRCRTAQIRVVGRLKAIKKIVLRTGELMQVISNLIANAIYAMPEGGILTIGTEDVEDGVVLTIEDTGVGIPKDKLSKIFDAFYTTRGSFGTGIGLFVVKQFVEGHGGRISVESKTEGEQRGTRLTIFLPEKNPYWGGEI